MRDFSQSSTTRSTSAPSASIYDDFKVLTVDRAGSGEWLPISTVLLLTAKGVATLRANSDATLVLLLDEG